MDFTCPGDHLLIRLLVALISAMVPVIILVAIVCDRGKVLNGKAPSKAAESIAGSVVVLVCLAACSLIPVLILYRSIGTRPVAYDSHQTLQNMMLVPAAISVFVGRRYVAVRNGSGLASKVMKGVYIALVVAAVLFAALLLQMLSMGATCVPFGIRDRLAIALRREILLPAEWRQQCSTWNNAKLEWGTRSTCGPVFG